MNNIDIIMNYIKKKKELYIKRELKENKVDSEEEIFENAENKFNYENWLESASKRARHYSIVTHNCKYTHSLSKSTSIYYKPNSSGNKDKYGILISGLLNVEDDAYGHAGSVDVFSFLKVSLNNGKTILEHLIDDTEEIRILFNIQNVDYNTLRENFLTIVYSKDKESFTDSKIKQVLFPVNNSYYVFSTLSASGIIHEMKKRIDELRFPKSELILEAKSKRRKDEYSENMYVTLPDLTMIGYGGSQPQNIGFLNKNDRGLAYLIHSVPPKFKKRKIILPRVDFFKTTFMDRWLYRLLKILGKQASNYYSNMNINLARKQTIFSILDIIFDNIFKIRAYKIGWSLDSQCSMGQKIFIDDYFEDKRTDSNRSSFIYEISSQICSKIGKIDDENLRSEIILIATKNFGKIL